MKATSTVPVLPTNIPARQRVARLATQMRTTFSSRDTYAGQLECPGLFLRMTTFATFPLTLPPLTAVYQGVDTEIRFRLDEDWHIDERGRHAPIPGLTFGGLVHETGIFLTAQGSLLLFRQGGKCWFELVHPRYAFYRKPRRAHHVRQATFHRSEDGTITIHTN
jgi:hypothetical protein